MATQLCRVGVKDDYVVRGPVCAHTVVFKRLARVEVKDKESWPFLVDDELVLLVAQRQELVFSSHQVQDGLPLIHELVELAELVELKALVVEQIPLSPAVVVAEVVAFPREVDPLWMPELVPHESEESLATQRLGDEPDHLVQSHASGDSDALGL